MRDEGRRVHKGEVFFFGVGARVVHWYKRQPKEQTNHIPEQRERREKALDERLGYPFNVRSFRRVPSGVATSAPGARIVAEMAKHSFSV